MATGTILVMVCFIGAYLLIDNVLVTPPLFLPVYLLVAGILVLFTV
ncbi:MAG TPA: hypothetical protein VIU33_06155 [Nitrospiria bacterium]